MTLFATLCAHRAPLDMTTLGEFASQECPAQKTAVYKEGGVTRLREVQNFKLGFAT